MTAADIVIERVDRADARVRNTLLVIATLFALVLLFHLGQLDHSWSVVRHALAQRADLLFTCEDLTRTGPRPEACARLTQKLNDDEINVTALRHYASQRYFSADDAHDGRLKQQQIYFDNVLRFNIPPLGVSVDANDLGPVAAFGFSALFLWLAICFDHQARALRGFVKLVSPLTSTGETRAQWAVASALTSESMFGAVPTGNRWLRFATRALHTSIAAPLALVVSINLQALQFGFYSRDIVPKQVTLTLVLGAVGTLLMTGATVIVLFQVWRMPSSMPRQRS